MTKCLASQVNMDSKKRFIEDKKRCYCLSISMILPHLTGTDMIPYPEVIPGSVKLGQSAGGVLADGPWPRGTSCYRHYLEHGVDWGAMVAVMFIMVGQWRTTTCNSSGARRQQINCLPHYQGGGGVPICYSNTDNLLASTNTKT